MLDWILLLTSTLFPYPTTLPLILAKWERCTFWGNCTRDILDLRTPTAQGGAKGRNGKREDSLKALSTAWWRLPDLFCSHAIRTLATRLMPAPPLRPKIVWPFEHTDQLKRKDLKGIAVQGSSRSLPDCRSVKRARARCFSTSEHCSQRSRDSFKTKVQPIVSKHLRTVCSVKDNKDKNK